MAQLIYSFSSIQGWVGASAGSDLASLLPQNNSSLTIDAESVITGTWNGTWSDDAS